MFGWEPGKLHNLQKPVRCHGNHIWSWHAVLTGGADICCGCHGDLMAVELSWHAGLLPKTRPHSGLHRPASGLNGPPSGLDRPAETCQTEIIVLLASQLVSWMFWQNRIIIRQWGLFGCWSISLWTSRSDEEEDPLVQVFVLVSLCGVLFCLHHLTADAGGHMTVFTCCTCRVWVTSTSQFTVLDKFLGLKGDKYLTCCYLSWSSEGALCFEEVNITTLKKQVVMLTFVNHFECCVHIEIFCPMIINVFVKS